MTIPRPVVEGTLDINFKTKLVRRAPLVRDAIATILSKTGGFRGDTGLLREIGRLLAQLQTPEDVRYVFARFNEDAVSVKLEKEP